ncbi:MAG: hypothetical protein OIF38_15710, partial [Cellvibrionaceae bacterium]|nr:hypothetical protein [Cellvibrionaceae bacterium]
LSGQEAEQVEVGELKAKTTGLGSRKQKSPLSTYSATGNSQTAKSTKSQGSGHATTNQTHSASAANGPGLATNSYPRNSARSQNTTSGNSTPSHSAAAQGANSGLQGSNTTPSSTHTNQTAASQGGSNVNNIGNTSAQPSAATTKPVASSPQAGNSNNSGNQTSGQPGSGKSPGLGPGNNFSNGTQSSGQVGQTGVPGQGVVTGTGTGKTNPAPHTSPRNLALISKHVYGNAGAILPSHITVVTKKQLNQLGLSGILLNDSQSGFKSNLYYNSKHGQYIYAFAGTEDGTDWKQNLAQGLGLVAEQYELAMQNALDIKDATGGKVHLTGHSLGGGLASAASLVSNTRATTFNSARVNFLTPLRHGANMNRADELIDAYYVEGELLNSIQHAIGNRIPLRPANNPIRWWHSPIQKLIRAYQLHSQDEVLNSPDL